MSPLLALLLALSATLSSAVVDSLEAVMERAVKRALDGRQCAADAQTLAALGLLETKMEKMAEQLTAMRQTAEERLQEDRGCREERYEEDPQPAAGPAPYQPPEIRACARSCLQLRDQGGSPPDGVYWFTGMPVPVLCDFSHDGGGWTLLLTAVSNQGWDMMSVLGRSTRAPSLTADYSILGHADAIRDLGAGRRFAYRLEAQAQTGRRRWGGIWLAPRDYSFVRESPEQTGVTLFRRFDDWRYNDSGIERRMPWLNTGEEHGLLSTSASFATEWWGTLVSQSESPYKYGHSPWIYPDVFHSGTVLYWLREEIA